MFAHPSQQCTIYCTDLWSQMQAMFRLWDHWRILALDWAVTTHLTPARTSRLHYNVVMCCIVMWGLSSAVINTLRNSIHPPDMEGPLKMVCCCPCDGLMKKGHTDTHTHTHTHARAHTHTHTHTIMHDWTKKASNSLMACQLYQSSETSR